MEEKKKHGGRREGSGRPSTGRALERYYVTKEEDAQIRKMIEQLRNGDRSSLISDHSFQDRGNWTMNYRIILMRDEAAWQESVIFTQDLEKSVTEYLKSGVDLVYDRVKALDLPLNFPTDRVLMSEKL